MKRVALFIVVVGLLGLLATAPALASVILVPDSPTVALGDLLDVDVVISGLGAGGPPSLGAFDLDVSFDPAILSPIDVTFDLFLGDPALSEVLTAFTFLPGVVDLAAVSLLSPAALDALQPGSFTLATLTFNALSSGTTTLALSQVILVDAFGQPIPAPSTVLLLASGLAGLGAVAWKTTAPPIVAAASRGRPRASGSPSAPLVPGALGLTIPPSVLVRADELIQ